MYLLSIRRSLFGDHHFYENKPLLIPPGLTSKQQESTHILNGWNGGFLRLPGAFTTSLRCVRPSWYELFVCVHTDRGQFINNWLFTDAVTLSTKSKRISGKLAMWVNSQYDNVMLSIYHINGHRIYNNHLNWSISNKYVKLVEQFINIITFCMSHGQELACTLIGGQP